MKPIVWLASFPKSGNTWFRTFLTNFLRNADAPANINDLDGAPIASARTMVDEAIGYDTGELTFDEVDRLRPDAYRHFAREAKETPYMKVHDAYTFLPDGQPLFPPDATQCALYFLRNPLDVCVSFAHHSGLEQFDDIIRRMNDPDSAFCKADVAEPNQLRQRLLSWSDHATSWVDAPNQRVLPMRYEDMKQQPEATFGAAIRFLGLPDDPARIKKAIEFSRFDELRKQEEKSGFDEKLAKAKSFFRKGETGSWREALTAEQVARVVADHTAAMRRFGYLDESGRPIY